MKVSVNLTNFTAAIREVQAVTKKTEAEIVTRAARNVAYRAAQYTPRSSAGRIRSRLRSGNLLARLASSELKREKGRYTQAELASRMRKIEKRRTSNVVAMRAGWAKAITDLGGSFRGARAKPSHSAARGFGKAATVGNLVSTIRNSVVTQSVRGVATGAGDIPFMSEALAQAVDFVTADMREYAKRKIIQNLKAATK